MGQAKNRGSLAERVAAARAQQEALKPTEMTCNECKAVITAEHIHLQDIRNMAGIEMVCGAVCPACSYTTWGFKGDEEAVMALSEVMAEQHPEGLSASVQPYKS